MQRMWSERLAGVGPQQVLFSHGNEDSMLCVVVGWSPSLAEPSRCLTVGLRDSERTGGQFDLNS